MVAFVLAVAISTEKLVTLFRFLIDSKIADAVGFASILSILGGLLKLPTLVKPSPGSLQTPYISALRKRRLLTAMGIITGVVTFVALWLRFLVPSEIGQVVNPPIEIESFRRQLEWFIISLGLVIFLQAIYWGIRLRIGYDN